MVEKHHENVVSNLDIGVRFYESIVKTNGYVPFHWHSSIELVFVMSGKLIFKFDGLTHVVEDNQFIVIPSGIVHDVTNGPNQALVLQIPLVFIEKYWPNPEQLTFVTDRPQDSEYQKVVRLLNKLNQVNKQENEGYLFDFGMVLLMIIKTVVLCFGKPEKERVHKDTSGLKELIVFINSHYSDQLSVKGLAQKFGYNPSYLSRLFKQQNGITLIEYVYEIRLNELYQSLITSDLPIKTLLKLHGLNNERTTREMFKKMYGVLPNQIRMKYRLSK